jgi:cobalt/nickel transport system permease protein
MHIPDGFLTVSTSAGAGVVAAVAVGAAVRGAARQLPPERVPMLGVGAAFIFAAQMVNFPVVGGTSGHLLGAALAVMLLGLPGAMLAMFTVVLLQCLLFQDGGLLALGANTLNMAVIGPVVAWLVLRALRRANGPNGWGAVMVAAWASVMAAALACAAELAISGTVPTQSALAAMGSVHALIGVGEAVLTVAALRVVQAALPEHSAVREALPS